MTDRLRDTKPYPVKATCRCGHPDCPHPAPAEPVQATEPANGSSKLPPNPVQATEPTTLATPCADCGHTYNWHRDGRCTVTAGPNGCGCDGFTAFHDEPVQATEPTCPTVGACMDDHECHGDCQGAVRQQTTNLECAETTGVPCGECMYCERARIRQIIEERDRGVCEYAQSRPYEPSEYNRGKWDGEHDAYRYLLAAIDGGPTDERA